MLGLESRLAEAEVEKEHLKTRLELKEKRVKHLEEELEIARG